MNRNSIPIGLSKYDFKKDKNKYGNTIFSNNPHFMNYLNYNSEEQNRVLNVFLQRGAKS